MSDVPATQIAWLAGIIDADGTITIEGDASHASRVQVAMASLATIDHVAGLFQRLSGHEPYRWKRDTPGHHADSHYVRMGTQAGVDALLESLEPYLVTKRKVAEVVRRRIALNPKRNGDRAPIEIAFREAKALNRKGGSVHHSAPFPDDPISSITWLPYDLLRANSWNPNRVFATELKLLKRNILTHRWLMPILVNPTGLIIDGFHRWALVASDPEVQALTDGMVPAAILDLADDEAMALTVRINRAKGSHIAVHMHDLVCLLATDHGWSRDRIAKSIGATLKEVDVLLQDGVFAIKNIKDHAYSQAWYPVETGTRTQDG